MPEFSPNRPFAGDEDPDWTGFDLKQFVRQTIQSAEWTDDDATYLEDRVIRIEECVAARWPRRWLLWARLRRELRASVAPYPVALFPRGDFRGRRAQACIEKVEAERRARERRHGGRS